MARVKIGADELESATDAGPHGLDRHALPARDLHGFQVLEKPQDQRRAIGLLEPQHGVDRTTVLLGARDERGGIVGCAASLVGFELTKRPGLNVLALPLASNEHTRDVSHDAVEPLPRRVPIGGGSDERDPHRLLRDVVGTVAIEDQLSREPARGVRVLAHDGIGTVGRRRRPGGHVIHCRGGAHPVQNSPSEREFVEPADRRAGRIDDGPSDQAPRIRESRSR